MDLLFDFHKILMNESANQYVENPYTLQWNDIKLEHDTPYTTKVETSTQKCVSYDLDISLVMS